MGYIIVLPQGVLTSQQRAEAISRELYCITRPRQIQSPDQADAKVFGVIAHPTACNTRCRWTRRTSSPCIRLATLERLVALFPELTEQERLNLQSYIFANQSFPFGNIVPSTTTVRDQAYMEGLGWFPNSEL
jgi:hypothetical protein